MTSWVIGPFVLVLLVAVGAHAKGIFDTKSDLQQVIPTECPGSAPYISPVQYLESTEQPLQPIATTLEKPPMNWPSDLYAPKVVGHTYHIYKTILRPQLFRQMIIVPYLQRYVRTFQAPVLETVHIQRDLPF